ncbi:sugar ABC transporter substrate-binding protein [Chloroflexota bacterium]
MRNRGLLTVVTLLALLVVVASGCAPGGAPSEQVTEATQETEGVQPGEPTQVEYAEVEAAGVATEPASDQASEAVEPTPRVEHGPSVPLDLVFVQHALCAWDSFWCTVEAGIQQAAGDMDINATILGPDVYDLEKVAQLIDQAVATQPDGIAVTVSDPDLMREPIQRALEAGIPVIAYNAGAGPEEDGIDYLTFLGQDEYQGGYLGGLRLADAGGANGVCINHQVGHVGLDKRCEGFLSAMTVSGLDGEVVATSNDPAESQTILDDYYAAHPDTNIFLTLGPNGANPFYAFMEAAGLAPGDLYHGTFDLSEEINARIADGTTLFGIDQQPFLQGYGAVSTLVMLNRYGLVPALPVTATGPGFVDANLLGFEADPGRDVHLQLVQHARCDWDSYWCVVENGIKQAAADMRVDAVITGPDSFDLEQVVPLIDQAAAELPNGMAVTVSSADLFRDPIQRAIDSGIPVVAYDSGAGPLTDRIAYMTFIGPDEYPGGYESGARLVAEGGSRAVCVNHQPGNAALDSRCQGFLQALTEQGIPAEVLEVGGDAAEAQALMNEYYAGNPDLDIVLTLGPSGSSPFYAFIQDAGLHAGAIKHGTFDIDMAVIARIKDGTTLFTVDQQPFLQGYNAVQSLMLHTRYGITPALPVTPTGPGFVDASNVGIAESLAGIYR